jgi:hypothetical protein
MREQITKLLGERYVARTKLALQYDWKAFSLERSKKQQMPAMQPVIIGALGGSGTRSFVSILRQAGLWMGDWNDPKTEDALAMRVFLARWFDDIFASIQANHSFPEQAVHAFYDAIQVHRAGISDAMLPWGWKNPRNMWLIPFYAQFFPGLKFIHVVRDGRDMALSKNQFLLQEHGDAVLGEQWRQNPVRAQLDLWERGNRLAQTSAEGCLNSENYLLIKYEDLCTTPDAVIKSMFDFLAVPLSEETLAACLKLISPSKRIGSWERSHALELESMEPRVTDALKKFGYG